MISEALQKYAITCAHHAEQSLSILERAISVDTKEFSLETLIYSTSFARRSEALTTLDNMILSGIFSHKNGIYVSTLSKDNLKTIYLLLKGMILAPINPYEAGVKIVLTPPRSPNRLENAIKDFGPQAGLIQKTDEIFDYLSHQAKRSLIVMTPFLDTAGAELIVKLFTNTAEDIEKKLILRFLSLGPGYAKYPSGYPPIREALKDIGVEVYDYAIKRERTSMLETFHAKTILSDDNEAYVGSTNFDQYSLENSMELGTVITGEPVRLLSCIIKSIISISIQIN